MNMESNNVLRLLVAMASTGIIKYHGKALEVIYPTFQSQPLYRTGRKTWTAFDPEAPGVKMAMIEFLAGRFGGYLYVNGKTLFGSFLSEVENMESNGVITLCKIA